MSHEEQLELAGSMIFSLIWTFLASMILFALAGAA
jgi:hypothetical protein